MLHAIAAIFFVQMDDGFRVAARAVAVPVGLQPSPQFSVIVNLAVEDDPDIMILVGQRLVAAFHVDNAQPPHGQADIFFDEEALVIGPAMHDAAVHARQHLSLNVPVAFGKEDSADSTHKVSSFLPRPACPPVADSRSPSAASTHRG